MSEEKSVKNNSKNFEDETLENDQEQVEEQDQENTQEEALEETEEEQENIEESLRDEIASLKDQLLRAVAETENIRKRSDKEKQDMSKYAITGFARDVLAVSDNLRRALESIPEEEKEKNALIKTIVEGVEMTESTLLDTLKKHGVEKISPLNEPFDHNFHQAMMEIPNSDQPDGTVVQVLQAGYVIKDRLLRPALVGVAKGGQKKEAQAESDDQDNHLDTTA